MIVDLFAFLSCIKSLADLFLGGAYDAFSIFCCSPLVVLFFLMPVYQSIHVQMLKLENHCVHLVHRM